MKTINSILLLIGTAFVCNVQGVAKKGTISYSTLSKFFDITFSDEDLKEGVYTDKNGDFKIPSGVTTVDIKPSGHFENVIISDTVKSINPDFFNNCEVEKIVVSEKTAKSILKGRYGENPAENLGTYFSLKGDTEIIIEDLLKEIRTFDKDQLRKVEETQRDKKDPFLSEIQNFNKGKLKKAKAQNKATQTEKSLQEQLNSRKSKLKKTETQKRDPKEYYVSPLLKDIKDFNHKELKSVKTDKNEKPNSDTFESTSTKTKSAEDNSVIVPTTDIFESTSAGTSSIEDNPVINNSKNSFLNSIENFDKTKLKKAEKIEKPEISDPFAAAFIKKVPVMENNKSDNDNDDDEDWDD